MIASPEQRLTGDEGQGAGPNARRARQRRDQAARARASLDRKRDAALVDALADEGRPKPHERARRAIIRAAVAGRQMTNRQVAVEADVSLSTVWRAKVDLAACPLVNVLRPAPIRNVDTGQVVGRDPGGTRYFLARLSRAAWAVYSVLGLGRPPKVSKPRSSTTRELAASLFDPPAGPSRALFALSHPPPP